MIQDKKTIEDYFSVEMIEPEDTFTFMPTILVLKFCGKSESIEDVSVIVFYNNEDAVKYCKELPRLKNEKDKRFWQYAQLVEENKEYELGTDKLR